MRFKHSHPDINVLIFEYYYVTISKNQNIDNFKKMSVKTLSLITGNTEKYEGFKSMLGPDFSYVTVKQDIKVPEYQGTPQEICKAKCEAAARILNAPVVIIDNALCINAWGGLPGK